ncbi:MAG: trimethylamine methyltransferase family protein [Alphaproteobacteria bacterium]|nr:trimethylamine methyltransferase family protein [Alphaproteobacteria bacterium]
MTERERRGRRGRRGASEGVEETKRATSYRKLRNTFAPQQAFSEDRVAAMHDTALRVLEELGIKVLNEDARARFKAAGATVDEDWMVRLDRGLVEEAIRTAPSHITLYGAGPEDAVGLGGPDIAFVGVGGAPHISDLDGGKRPGTMEDAANLIRLAQEFDVIHILAPNVEPQDVDTHIRHYEMSRAQLTLATKPPFVYARGRPQALDCFEMIRIARGLSPEAFAANPYCFTVINSNSPRQLDIPMCQGIMDFAEAGQPTLITPFTLAGAMAPVTMAGALTLAHAEALAGLTLAQIVRPGAPVLYGSFTSNVDMKSGSPAFGTPEFVKAALGAGQLARYIDIPWRGSVGTASNAPDEQATYETLMSMWGNLLGGAHWWQHAAGWIEGGLTASMEKFILDVEMLQIFAETLVPLGADDDEIGFDAIADVAPGGHFFSVEHTMSRYRSAFYEPMLSDWRNFGQWTEAGSETASTRANRIWKQRLADFVPPPVDPAIVEALDAFVARRREEGGAPPVS